MSPTRAALPRLDQLRRMDRGAGGHRPARGRASSRVAGGCWRRGRMRRGTTAASPRPRRWPMGCSSTPPTARTCAPPRAIPLRLLLPGFEGNMNVKWLRRLKVGTEPWHTRWETPHYSDLMPDGTAREFTFVMEAKSVITSPSGGQRLPGPGFVEITGLAWSGRGRIARVDVSTDGGQTLDGGDAAGAGAADGLDALPPALDVGRPAGAAAEPGHRRDRLRAADASRSWSRPGGSTPSTTTTGSRPGPSRPMGR